MARTDATAVLVLAIATAIVGAGARRESSQRLLGAGGAADQAMPFVGGDTLLLVGTLDGQLHALEGATGALLWTRETGGQLVSSSFLAHLEAEGDGAQQKAGGPNQSTGQQQPPSRRAPLEGSGNAARGDEGDDWLVEDVASDDAAASRPPAQAQQQPAPPHPQPQRSPAAAPPPPPPRTCPAPSPLSPPPPLSPRPAAPPLTAPSRVASSSTTATATSPAASAPPPPPPPPPLPRRPLLPPWLQQPVGVGGGRFGGSLSGAPLPPPTPVTSSPPSAEVGALTSTHGTDGDFGDTSAEDDESLLVLPGLDGSLFVIGADGEAHPLTDFTVQELVAEPTIFGEGALVGSKSVRLHALDARTGAEIYAQDTASADCADEACRAAVARGAAGETREGGAPPNGSSELPQAGGQLLVSRADFSVRVLEKLSGRQRWNVSLAQYSIEYVGSGGSGELGGAAADTPPQRLSLQLKEGHALCASSGRGESDGESADGADGAADDEDGGLAACAWQRQFDSPPVLMYRVETSTGMHQQLAFTPRNLAHLPSQYAADDDTEHVASTDVSLASPAGGAYAAYTYDYRAGVDLTLPSMLPAGAHEWGEWGGEEVSGAEADEQHLAVALAADGQPGSLHHARRRRGVLSAQHRAFYMKQVLGPAAPLVPLLPYISTYHQIRLPLPEHTAALPAPGDDASAVRVGGALAPMDGHADDHLGSGGGKVSIERLGAALDETTLLSDASLREIWSAVRRRLRVWKLQNRLTFYIIMIAFSFAGAYATHRLRQYLVRRRARKAKQAATQAAAAAVLARPASPEALSALTVALATQASFEHDTSVALRRVSVALGGEGREAHGDDAADLLMGSSGERIVRRIDSSGSDMGGPISIGGLSGVPSPLTASPLLTAPDSPEKIAPLAMPPVALQKSSRYVTEFEQGVRLGKGGFGRVYRAKHILDGAEYAVKKVLLTGSAREQERAVREAMCLAKLDHSNVVRYYQVRDLPLSPRIPPYLPVSPHR